MNPTTPSRRSIPRLAASGAGLALLAGAALTQLGAQADPVSSDIPTTCAIGTGSFDVSVPVTVDDTIDPVVEGGQEILVLDTGMPQLPVEATIDRLVVTMPIPSQIASVDDVSFSGGNMTGDYVVSGSNLVLTFTGPQASSTMELPTVTADQTVATGIAPTTITWTTFSKIDADTNYGTATCVPKDAGQVVNTTTVEAGDSEPTPTTEPAPTTEPTEPTEPTPTTAPTEPTPTTEPSEPTPSEPPAGDEPDVSIGVEAQADLPDLPATPGVPAPGSGGPSTPGVPPVPGLPSPPPAPPAGPGLPDVETPTVPPVPAPPAVPAPVVPTPAVPTPPALPAPTPAPAPAPVVVPLPGLPGLPDLELDAEVIVEVGLGF